MAKLAPWFQVDPSLSPRVGTGRPQMWPSPPQAILSCPEKPHGAATPGHQDAEPAVAMAQPPQRQWRHRGLQQQHGNCGACWRRPRPWGCCLHGPPVPPWRPQPNWYLQHRPQQHSPKPPVRRVGPVSKLCELQPSGGTRPPGAPATISSSGRHASQAQPPPRLPHWRHHPQEPHHHQGWPCHAAGSDRLWRHPGGRWQRRRSWCRWEEIRTSPWSPMPHHCCRWCCPMLPKSLPPAVFASAAAAGAAVPMPPAQLLPQPQTPAQ
mmetsp:Transcript_52640/g.133666  ORF Transcript_52640/g.133666 Transcript_52640/m.133666 type:complete len:265 (-) Transcript_52640:418-1212(-)